jgi:pimeloyl-ACP methyl ester carboxylesterase
VIDELTVPGTPELVVADFGGRPDGPAVVLLHGFGGNCLHWAGFAPLLTDRCRVFAMDLRGHGRSGDGAWRWDALVGDVRRVVEHLGLPRPVVVGHSLGGFVATMWAEQHPECRALVNLDGLRPVETGLPNYVGGDPEVIRRQRAELSAVFAAREKAEAGAVDDDRYASLREQYRQLGGDAAVAELARNVVEHDGSRYVRPAAEIVRAFRVQLRELDIFPVLAAVKSPALVCTATRPMPGAERFADLLDAHRRGVDRDLAAARQANPGLRVKHVPASHNMIYERPRAIAALIRDFLGETGAE